jgi:hypothetical protein
MDGTEPWMRPASVLVVSTISAIPFVVRQVLILLHPVTVEELDLN